MPEHQGDGEHRPFRPTSRLHRPTEFAAVMASPLHLRSGCFELRYRRNAAGGELGIRARLGLVIPKRLARQAVLRNQLKRLAREAFRHALPSLASVDVVLRLSKPALIANGKSGSEERRRWRSDIDGLLAGMRK